MPKLPRVTVVQYGANGPSTDFGQFGSKAAAAPQTSQNPSIIMQLTAWGLGWTAAAVGAAFNPYLEDMNGAFYVFGYFLANIFERGIPDWDAGTTYYKGATVQDPAGSGQQFISLTDNNINNALPLGASNAQWQWNNSPQLPIGAVIETMGIFAEPNFLMADGSQVSRATYADLFNRVTIQTPGTLVAGNAQITGIPSTANLKVGWFISGTGIPTGAKILSIDSPTAVTMNGTGLSNQTGTTLVFAPWGVGDGSTTFTLLDSRRRVAVGPGGAGTLTLPNAIGAYGGEETHTLTIAEIPAHTHTWVNLLRNFGSGGGGSGNPGSQFTDNTGSTGGGGAHNNVQPSYVVTKMVKYQ